MANVACVQPSPQYPNPPFRGIRLAASRGDGHNIDLFWYQATPDQITFSLAYNIYFSTDRDDVISEGVKFVVTDPTQLSGTVDGLTPGDVYYFLVRATEFPINDVNLKALPLAPNGCRIYPEGALLQNITATDTIIPVQDADTFPPFGIIQIGCELIKYTNVSIPNSSLILNSVDDRGFNNTKVTIHNTDGYDGYQFRDPLVRFWTGFDDHNTNVVLEESKAEFPNYPITKQDGYKEKNSIVYTDLSSQDIDNEDFLRFDFAGYRRNSPDEIFEGLCIGTYIGGEYYCADGYEGVGRQIRGIPFQDLSNQREEVLLESTGVPCVLVRRMTAGKVSNNYTIHRENEAHRGLDNTGTDLVVGYEQFFNPRRSDGRILVRFGPTKEDIAREEMGLENKFTPNCWTLVFPSIKDGDFIIRINKDGSEEFRYEIIDVERNDTVLQNQGAQKFTAVRVRKTDPIYQFRVIRDTATMPTQFTTSFGEVPGLLIPHMHRVVLNEGVVALSQINQTTNVVQGHNHPVINGVVQEVLGHTHTILFP